MVGALEPRLARGVHRETTLGERRQPVRARVGEALEPAAHARAGGEEKRRRGAEESDSERRRSGEESGEEESDSEGAEEEESRPLFIPVEHEWPLEDLRGNRAVGGHVGGKHDRIPVVQPRVGHQLPLWRLGFATLRAGASREWAQEWRASEGV